MAKAVLIMDMPETCKDCSCKYPSYKDDALYDCAITGKTIPINGGCYAEKPYWCPLRELPEKNPNNPELKPGIYYTEKGYEVFKSGWNACLDNILK